jgi:type VII secretion protein EccB
VATRRDQLQSYQFLTQRVISAFTMRETDPRQSPLRRGIGAVFGGLMIAVLVGAGFGVYGIMTKIGDDTWRTDGSVVVEKETGASYVYFAGALHPTLNYTSAMLATGKPNPRVFRVSSRSLASVPRGVTVGIAGAPTSLPGPRSLIGLPWTLCTVPTADRLGRPAGTVALAVGAAPTGGRALADEGLLVRDPDADLTYLIWHGHRYQLRGPATVVPALFGAVTPTRAGTAWLNGLPAGATIGPIPIEGRGERSGAVPQRRVGDVLTTETGSGPQFYVVFDDGLAPITPLQEALVTVASQAQPERISVAEATSAPSSSRLSGASADTAPPPVPPDLVGPGEADALCAVTDDASAAPRLWVGGSVAGLDKAGPTVAASPDGVRLADFVYVPGGRVAVVRALGAPGAQTGPYFVVTDLGIRYPVSDVEALAMLGFMPIMAVDVPASLVTRLPAGPTLDPAAAVRPAPPS